MLFNIYWYIFSALSREWGGSENQIEHKIFSASSNYNWQCKINKNTGDSAGWVFSSLVSPDELHSREEKWHSIYNTACKFMVKYTWIQFPRKKAVPMINTMKGNLWFHRNLWNSFGGAFGQEGSNFMTSMKNYFKAVLYLLSRNPT